MYSLVSNLNKNTQVVKMYKKTKMPHLRTEIVILTPIKDDNLEEFREILFQQKMNEVLEKINLDIEEKLGEMFEVDVEQIYTSAKNLTKNRG